ncbi:hypothetical protein VW23_010550 [Devosia insulae DS-56]|uniref:Uncharacterized protein n=1 Tax=Devosia insulae DS-56 TaxID=1116389 RepID=A0A1E5XVM6_9HYPH|nr:hypothetical protein [Devosia insulae]OEO32645.1 hypothetical protein VW23_010550 [Devosia insulae DS-56]
MKLFVALAAVVMASPALAEEMVACTPEHYYNSSETPPLIITIDKARAAGSRVTRIDLETGAYREHFIGSENDSIEAGGLKVINPGSLRERIDFVALDSSTGFLLRISLIDQDLPFVRVDTEGTVASGHCTYVSELPR